MKTLSCKKLLCSITAITLLASFFTYANVSYADSEIPKTELIDPEEITMEDIKNLPLTGNEKQIFTFNQQKKVSNYMKKILMMSLA